MENKKEQNKYVGSTIVLGGGIGGMQTALDLADVGIKVYLVDSASAIGGRMVQLDKTFPTNECAMCVVSPKLVDCARHFNIEIITNSEIESIEGEAGNFEVTICKKARFVDMDKCTGCNECTLVCPVEVPSKFDSRVGKNKAIHRLYPQAVPDAFIISKRGQSPCRANCPAGVNAHGYVTLIRAGKFKEALELIRERDPFPSICGRVCYHPCESECLRKELDDPVSIRALKRFVADYQVTEADKESIVASNSKQHESKNKIQSNGKKVAVVGAGPAGLTCAYDLVRLGYEVIVYEKFAKAGGMLLTGIPNYRLPQEILEAEIKRLTDLGIKIKTNVQVGKDITLSDLQSEYQAVFIAVGAHISKKLGVPGEDVTGVIHGVDYLREFNLGGKVDGGKKVVILGGGNVAIDSARTALRLEAEEVTMVYRRSRAEMPASPWEIMEAEEEGVKFHFLAAPTKVLSENGRVTGMECIKMELGEPDDSGRRRPVPIEGSEFTIETDLIIPAIGQSPDLLLLGDTVDKTSWGTIKTDSLTLETSVKGIFAGGDAVLGPASVVDAMAGGHEAAITIDRYIKGEDLKKGREQKKTVASTIPDIKVKKQERVKLPVLPLEKRKGNFAEVELPLTEEEAVQEAMRCMDCGICSECRECEKVCEACAILYNMHDEQVKIKAGAIIIAPGVSLFDADTKKEYGYDRYDNVITSIQFERILSSSGPTKGEVVRPSDGSHPKKIAFIQCVGSRDPACGNEYCSSVCCMYSIKEAIIAREHDPEIEATIFYIDIRTFGKDFERYYETAKNDHGIKFVRCMISKIYEQPKSKNLVVKYIDETGKMQESEFDLVTLAVGMTNTASQKLLSEKLGIETNEYDFCSTKRTAPGKTSKDGIFVVGTYAEPKDIPETVAEGSSAAALASALLKNARGTLVKEKEYPPERKISDEETRIGVFICRCGRNIASVVDVPEVVKYAAKLDDVVFSSEFLYSCSKDALDTIKEKIAEHNLNRVVVASCTPRTHEELFRDTVRETGLNRYLFEMTSLREQVSWVHKDDPKWATEKSKELVSMMVAKTRLVHPLGSELADVIPVALVIGGGASGMQAALYVEEQGYETYLIEKEDTLGGHLRDLFYNPDEPDTQGFLKTLVEKVTSNEKIHVMKKSKLKDISGFVGNYSSVIDCEGKEKEIKHGVVIVATGAKSYEPKPKEYGFGQSQNIVTQVTLEEQLVKSPESFSQPQTFVMIQCVGSRNEEHPFCSRICCTHAIKNALRLKEINPEHNVIVLYRDIRTYGFMEKYYLKAREEGVVFSCFDTDKEPQVNVNGNEIIVKQMDRLLQEEVTLNPDWVILSAGIDPGDNDELAKTLKVPLTMDGFFLEAHAKIRPLDFTSDGMFMCGLAHSPRLFHESLAQAQGASVRAVTILSKDKMEAKAITAEVNTRVCRGCGICISVCPYGARELDEDTKTAKVIEVMCQGCGGCAVACPSGATIHKGFNKKQIMAMIDKSIK